MREKHHLTAQQSKMYNIDFCFSLQGQFSVENPSRRKSLNQALLLESTVSIQNLFCLCNLSFLSAIFIQTLREIKEQAPFFSTDVSAEKSGGSRFSEGMLLQVKRFPVQHS